MTCHIVTKDLEDFVQLMADTLNILFENLYDFSTKFCDAVLQYVLYNKQLCHSVEDLS